MSLTSGRFNLTLRTSVKLTAPNFLTLSREIKIQTPFWSTQVRFKSKVTLLSAFQSSQSLLIKLKLVFR